MQFFKFRDIDATKTSLPPSKKAKNTSLQTSYTDKNPVMILNELRTGLKYECAESGDTPTTKRYLIFL